MFFVDNFREEHNHVKSRNEVKWKIKMFGFLEDLVITNDIFKSVTKEVIENEITFFPEYP